MDVNTWHMEVWQWFDMKVFIIHKLVVTIRQSDLLSSLPQLVSHRNDQSFLFRLKNSSSIAIAGAANKASGTMPALHGIPA